MFVGMSLKKAADRPANNESVNCTFLITILLILFFELFNSIVLLFFFQHSPSCTVFFFIYMQCGQYVFFSSIVSALFSIQFSFQ